MNKKAILSALALLSVNAFAENVVDFTTPTIDFSNNPNWTLGFAFHVNSPIDINGLSIYDDLKDGLSTSHAAALWTSGGTLLASAVIPAGTAAPLDGFFRVQSISTITLGVGDYVVGARSEGENYTWNPADFTTIPEVTFLGDRYVEAAGLAFPTESSQLNGWFGGNATVTRSDTVPDATSTFGLLSIGLIGLATVRRK